jgi:diguanylate cyclase (GGDEF)-like protein
MEVTVQEIHWVMRYNHPISLLVMDIDPFKNFNDRYGHQIRDQLICQLVWLCRKQLCKVVTLARYGGEEFVVLMQETASEGAMLAYERLRDKIEKMKINTSAGGLSITDSMGLASLDRDLDDTDTLDTMIKVQTRRSMLQKEPAGIASEKDECPYAVTAGFTNGNENRSRQSSAGATSLLYQPTCYKTSL